VKIQSIQADSLFGVYIRSFWLLVLVFTCLMIGILTSQTGCAGIQDPSVPSEPVIEEPVISDDSDAKSLDQSISTEVVLPPITIEISGNLLVYLDPLLGGSPARTRHTRSTVGIPDLVCRRFRCVYLRFGGWLQAVLWVR